MKASLTFTLPKEAGEFREAVNGARVAKDISDFDGWLRESLRARQERLDDVIEGTSDAREIRHQILTLDAVTEMFHKIFEL